MAYGQAISPDDITALTWLENLGVFLTTTEQFTHEYLISLLAKDYYRFQASMDTNLGLDAVSEEDIAELLQLGQKVITDDKEGIEDAMRKVVDDKIGKTYSCPQRQDL